MTARSKDDENGDNGLPSDKLTMILLHVGETRKGIKRLESDVAEVKESVCNVQSSTVRKDECSQRHMSVAQTYDVLSSTVKELRDTLRELRRKDNEQMFQGGEMQPSSISSTGGSGAFRMSHPSGFYPPVNVEEVIEKREEKSRKTIAFWLSVISAVVALGGGVTAGIIKIGRYMDRVDAMLEQGAQRTEATKQELKDEIAKKPRTIYVKTLALDSGVTAAPQASPPSRKQFPSSRKPK